MASLPQGFKLDAPSEAVALPEGFTLDPPQAEAPMQEGNWIADSFKRGTANALAMFHGFSQAYGQLAAGAGQPITDPASSGLYQTDPFNGDRVRKEVEHGTSLSEYRRYRDEAGKYPARVPSFKDVNSLGTAVQYVGERIAENVPNMAASTATFGMAGIPLGVGEVQGNLIDKGVTDRPELAAAAGLPSAALEVVTPLTLANKILSSVGVSPTKAVAGGVVKRVAKGAVEGFVSEGLTEGAQEGLSLGAEAAAGVPSSLGEGVSRILESAVAGGVAGGGLSGMVSMLPSYGELPPPPDMQVEGIRLDVPPPPPAPEQAPLFMEDPEPVTPAAPGEPAVVSPAVQPIEVNTDVVLSPAAEQPQPLTINALPADQDLQTYGNFTEKFTEIEGAAGTPVWRHKDSFSVISQTQDSRYQLNLNDVENAQSWVFPTMEQAAWVAENIKHLEPRTRRQIKDSFSSEQVTQHIYENGTPKQAFFAGLDGNRIRIENVDTSSGKAKSRTFKDLDTLRSNPRVMQYLTGASQVAEMVKAELKARGYNITSNLSYAFWPDKTAAYGFNQDRTKTVINLASPVFRERPSDGMASSLINTVIHELAHDYVRGHNREFASLHGRMTDALHDKFAAQAMATEELFREENIPYLGGIHAIRRIIGDPAAPGQLDPRLRQALFGDAVGASSARDGGIGAPVPQTQQLPGGRETGSVQESSDRADIQLKPAVITVGSELAQPLWFSRLGNVLFGPRGIYSVAKQLSVEQLLAIANNPERYGIRPDEVRWTGMKVWLEGLEEKVSREAAEDWFERHQVRVEEEIRQDPQVRDENVQPTRYYQYVTPGPSSTYSELLMIWRGAEYTTPHFGANEIVHARFNVRKTPQGRVLFIEEIQSDWHQRGREAGYKPQGVSTQLEAKQFFGITDRDWNGLSEVQRQGYVEEMQSGEPHVRGGVPQAPFSNSWHELALKRLIRWAAENGLDGIAWTPSKMQQERYPREGHEGEAFKILYDKEIPKFLEKYLKQWGVKVGRTNVQVGGSLQESFNPGVQPLALQPGVYTVQSGDGEFLIIAPNGEILDTVPEEQDAIELAKDYTKNSQRLTPTSVPFFSFNDTMRESVLEGQPLLKELPPESRLAGQHVTLGLEESGAIEDTIDRENANAAMGYLDRFGWLRKKMSTVLQLAFDNPHIPSLQTFTRLMQAMAAEKNSWKYKGEQILKDWQRLGKVQSNNLTNFLFEATAKSDELGRRLTLEELADLGREHSLTPDAQEVFGRIDSLFQSVLNELKNEELARVARTATDPVHLAALQGQVTNEFAALLNRNYFPYTRFGNNVLFVRATEDVEYQGKLYKKGQTMHLSTYSSRRERDSVFHEFRGRFAGVDGAEIGTRTLKEEVATFQGLPPGMLKTMEQSLNLSEEQRELAEMLINSYRPSRSFIQHMRKRRGIGGFSYDGQRVFSSYLQSAAGHIARIKYKDELKNQVNATRASTSQVVRETGQGALRDDIANAMDGYLEAALHPREDLGELKSLIFFTYFGFVPVQALVNVMQLPMMTYPHLLAKYGPVKAARALAKAMADVSRGFSFDDTPNWSKWNFNKRSDALSNLDRRMTARAIQDGLADESFAVQIAQHANGSLIDRLLPYELHNKIGVENVRDANAFIGEVRDLGIAPFKMSEEWNRRVALLAATRLEYEATQNEEAAYNEGRETIQQTMFEYQGWNRVPLARALDNKASLLLLFKTFAQHSLWYYSRGRGRMPALFAMALFAGLEGLPFAEDIIEIMNTAFSSMGKKFDVRKNLRTWLSTLMDDPDTVMHGISRHSFGLGYLQNVPDWDFSNKIGQGRIVPGIGPAMQKARGEIKTEQFMVRFMEEWAGVAGGYGMNAVRAMVDMGPDGMKWRQAFAPAAIRNITRTTQVQDNGTVVDYKGDPLVKFDQTDPMQQLEMYGQLFGFRPTRLAKAQEKLYLMSQEAAFYTARKGHLLTQLEQAYVQGGDKEARAAAVRELKHYNETSPPEFRLSGETVNRSLSTRARNNSLRTRGLPAQQSWRRLHQEWNKAFPSQ